MKKEKSDLHTKYEKDIVHAIISETKKKIELDKGRRIKRDNAPTQYLETLDRKIFESILQIRTLEKKPKKKKVKKTTLQKNNTKKLSAAEITCIKLCIKHSWYQVRSKLNPIDAGAFRWHLTMLAEKMLGIDEAFKLKLPFLKHRHLVVRPDKVMEMGMDTALDIIAYIRFQEGVRVKDNRINENDAIVRLAIELLWQGMKIKDIMNMTALHLDPAKKIVLIQSGKTYRIAVMDDVFWTRIRGLLKKAGKWFRSFLKPNAVSIGRFKEKWLGSCINAKLKNVFANFDSSSDKHNAKEEPYQPGEISMKPLKKTFITAYNFINNIFAGHGIYRGNVSNTPENHIIKIFNEIIDTRDLCSKINADALGMTGHTAELLKEIKNKLAAGKRVELMDARTLNKAILRKIYPRVFASPLKEVTSENFRQAGLVYKIIHDGLLPACLSSFYGPELPTNVLCLYDKFKLPEKTRSRKNIGGEESCPVGNSKEIREIIAEYCITNNKPGAYQSLLTLITTAVGEIKYVIEWLLSLLTKKGKPLSPETIKRYFDAVLQILVCCEVEQIGISEIDEDNIISIASPGQESPGGKEFLLNHHTVYILKTAVNSFSKCLEKKNISTPDINWEKIQQLVDYSPRLIFLPEEKAFNTRLGKFTNFQIEKNRKKFLIGLLGYYLGLRRKEIFTAPVDGVRIFGSEEDYIEVMGKGAKLRRVPLNLLPDNYKSFFEKAYKIAIKKNYKTLLCLEKIYEINELFYEGYKDIARSGLHSLRHAFATRHLGNGVDPMRVASWMGHESLRVLQNTYDQSLWDTAKKACGSSHGMKTEVKTDELKNFLSSNRTTLYRHNWPGKATTGMKQGKNVVYNFEKIINTNKIKDSFIEISEDTRKKILKSRRSPIDIHASDKKITDTVFKCIRQKKMFQKKKPFATIFKELCGTYIYMHKKKWKPRTLKRNKSILNGWQERFQKLFDRGVDKNLFSKEVVQNLSARSKKQYIAVLKSIVNNPA